MYDICEDGRTPAPRACKSKTTVNAPTAVVTMPESYDTVTRDYLLKRVATVYEAKKLELYRFLVEAPGTPRTMADMIDRITNGKFTYKEGYTANSEGQWNTALDFISWRTKPEDQAGYEAAKKVLIEDSTEVRDQIMVKDPDSALDALKAFEAKSYIG